MGRDCCTIPDLDSDISREEAEGERKERMKHTGRGNWGRMEDYERKRGRKKRKEVISVPVLLLSPCPLQGTYLFGALRRQLGNSCELCLEEQGRFPEGCLPALEMSWKRGCVCGKLGTNTVKEKKLHKTETVLKWYLELHEQSLLSLPASKHETTILHIICLLVSFG